MPRELSAAPDGPVLSAILDPQLGRALRAFDADPGADWTLVSMEREAGLSRTVFARRETATSTVSFTRDRPH